MDSVDKKILYLIQRNATLPLSEISKKVGISPTPCWNRIKKMEEKGIIHRRVTVLDRVKLGLPIVVFLSISVSNHPKEWVTQFLNIINKYDEIVEVHRLTGANADYMLKILASNIEDYNNFQQLLISQIEFTSVSSSISLQEMKHEITFPLNKI